MGYESEDKPRYEYEQTDNDDKMAKMGLAGAAILGLGYFAKTMMDGNKAKKNAQIEQVRQQISAKQSRINDLEAKWFPSTAQQQELARLKREVAELKKML